jgi:hypothetical protein
MPVLLAIGSKDKNYSLLNIIVGLHATAMRQARPVARSRSKMQGRNAGARLLPCPYHPRQTTNRKRKRIFFSK